MDEKKRLAISGVCGVVAPVIALGCIFLAIASWHDFSWTGNALSDLGAIGGTTRLLFNFGLIFAGMFGLVFAYGFPVYFRGWDLGKYATWLFALDAVALAAVGAFPSDFMPETHIHFYVSVAFFALFPLSALFMTIGLWQAERQWLFYLSVCLATVAALVWLLHWTVLPFGEGIAIPEMIASLCAGVWAAVLGVSMLGQSGKTTP
ncbi:Uncharacterised protein [uncultured archaeon]|nr:Uncharacterised protein [uncultured archaeon]